MIEARPNRWLRRFFGWDAQKRFAKSFHAVRIHGLDNLRSALADSPVLAVSNHTSWWDPLFTIYLAARLVPMDGYAMMLAENLRRLPFLGRLGGFGFDPDDPEDRSRAIAYAAGLLDRPGRLVWIYPQGKERAVTERPLAFRPGAAVVASRAPQARIIPVGFRYAFDRHEKPTAWVSFGPPIGTNSHVERTHRAQEQSVEAELERIEAALRHPTDAASFQPVLRHRPGWLGRLLERIMARLTRY